MDTIKIVFFLVASIIVGVLIIQLISSFNYKGMYNTTSDLITDNVKYDTRLSYEKYLSFLSDYTKNCKENNIKETIIYLEGNGLVNKQKIFTDIKNLNWCNSIQSLQESCGKREDINDFSFSLPAVIRVSCDNKIITLS